VKYEDAFEEGFEDMKQRQPDLTKINKYIGYKPKYNLDKILERIILHFEK
jgi:UDP-glucose 4-epimerase